MPACHSILQLNATISPLDPSGQYKVIVSYMICIAIERYPIQLQASVIDQCVCFKPTDKCICELLWVGRWICYWLQCQAVHYHPSPLSLPQLHPPSPPSQLHPPSSPPPQFHPPSSTTHLHTITRFEFKIQDYSWCNIQLCYSNFLLLLFSSLVTLAKVTVTQTTGISK